MVSLNGRVVEGKGPRVGWWVGAMQQRALLERQRSAYQLTLPLKTT